MLVVRMQAEWVSRNEAWDVQMLLSIDPDAMLLPVGSNLDAKISPE